MSPMPTPQSFRHGAPRGYLEVLSQHAPARIRAPGHMCFWLKRIGSVRVLASNVCGW